MIVPTLVSDVRPGDVVRTRRGDQVVAKVVGHTIKFTDGGLLFRSASPHLPVDVVK